MADAVHKVQLASGQVVNYQLDGHGLPIEMANGLFVRLIVAAMPDGLSPTPNPATWALEPEARSSSQVAMAATESEDPSGDPASLIQYKLVCETDDTFSSEWLHTNVYVRDGIPGATLTTWHCLSRDSAEEETAISESKSCTTPAAPDTEGPTPNPSTFAVAPAASGQTSIAMTATTATDPSGGVEYYFRLVSGVGGHDSGWQSSSLYEDVGLTPDEDYVYAVRTRDALGNESTESDPASAHTDAPVDSTPPTPDPSTWASPPAAVDSTSITMTATVATDPALPVWYSFENVTTVGHNSGWQLSPTWVDTGLPDSTFQEYRVQTKDGLGNVGGFSITLGATTDAPTGGGFAPEFSPITICPESNADLTPMVWPNVVSPRCMVDGHGLATTVTVEIDVVPFPLNAPAVSGTVETFQANFGSITAKQAMFGFRKVGKHIRDRAPLTPYFIRFVGRSSAGTGYSAVLSVTTPAENIAAAPVVLAYQGLDAKSPTELKPYWQGRSHNGHRFAWKLEWSTASDFSTLIGQELGFYDGPSQSVVKNGTTYFPQAEFKWTLLGLPANTLIYARLSTANRGGYSEDVRSWTTDTLTDWSGAVDQKEPANRWGQLRSDPRDMNSPPLSKDSPMVFGADVYDGHHGVHSTVGGIWPSALNEDNWTVFVDHTGYTTMWDLAFHASTDSGAGSGSGTSNIAKAVRALRGIGGIVRVAYDAQAPYKGGEYGGLSNSSSPRASAYEAWWDNGLSTGDVNYRAYPLTYVRIQACDVNQKPRILNGINVSDSHGGANGIYFYGINFRNSGSNASSIFMPGYGVGGIVASYRGRLDVDPTSTAEAGYGVKWHAKGTGSWSYDFRWNSFSPAHEHSIYGNSPGALGAIDNFLIGNTIDQSLGQNQANVRANGRTGFQFDSRGDQIAAGNSLGTQTGLPPGRGTLYLIGNTIANGSGKGGGSGGKGLSIPGHRGKVVVDQHQHLPDPDGNDYGLMNPIEDPQKGAWANENGFAVDEVELRGVSWRVTDTIATMLICNSTERLTILERPSIVMNNRVAFGFTEVTTPPFPRSCGMVTMSFAGENEDALRNDPCWPANLSKGNKVKHEFSSSITGSPVFDDTPAGQANFNALQFGMVMEAIV